MSFIIGTAGHIDHGKTSLIKALAGMDTDHLKEEKDRGISIDLGFAYIDLPDGTRAGIVDVPGHERFIRNMLAGATGIDLVLFTVAADDGIMPQTREHLEIMHLLRISKGIFAITKTDLVGENRVAGVISDIKELIKNTSLKDSPIIPVSSLTGSGIHALKDTIAGEIKEVEPRDSGGLFRLAVDRSFSKKGFGTVITGTVASGKLGQNSDAVIISKRAGVPRKIKVRGIQSYFRQVDCMVAGQRAAVNLTNIAPADIKRGDILASKGLITAGSLFDVLFEFLDTAKRPVKDNSLLKLYHLTDETLAQVFFAEKKEAGPGCEVAGQIRLKEPLAMMRGDRFILRDPSINATIGGGRVLLPYAKRKRGGEAGYYQRIDGHDIGRVLTALLSDRGATGIDAHTVRLMLNLTEKQLEELVRGNGEVTQFNGRIVLIGHVKTIEQSIIEYISRYHSDMPGDIGVEENMLKSGLNIANGDIIQCVMSGLIRSGRIAKTGNIIHMPNHTPEAKGIEREIEDAMLSLLSEKGFDSVRKEELLGIICRKGWGKKDVEKVLQILLKKGILVRLTEDSYTSRALLEDAKGRLENWISANNRIKAAEFRDLLGSGRKFAIELLEYFDKEKITLRSGDYRILRKKNDV